MVESEAQRAARGSHARRRRVRPPAAAGGDRADPRAGRGRRQAAVGLAAAGEGRGADRPASRPSPKRTCATRTSIRSKQARSQRIKEIAREGRQPNASTPTRRPMSRRHVRQRAVRPRSEDRARADPLRRAAHRRPRHAHRAPDLASAPACCRARTARRSSRAARRRRSSSPRSAPRATSRSSTR